MSGPQSREGVARPLGVADAGARTMGERLAAVRHQLGFSQRRAAERARRSVLVMERLVAGPLRAARWRWRAA